MQTPKTITDFVPEPKQLPFFQRWCVRFWTAMAYAIGIEIINRFFGPNANNVSFAAWMFVLGLICFALGALAGGRRP